MYVLINTPTTIHPTSSHHFPTQIRRLFLTSLHPKLYPPRPTTIIPRLGDRSSPHPIPNYAPLPASAPGCFAKHVQVDAEAKAR